MNSGCAPIVARSTTQIGHHGFKLNPQWEACLEESLREVFGIMLGLKVQRCANLRLVPGLTALVGLTGSLDARFTIRCSRHAATNLASRMLTPEAVHGEEQIFDALGEVCNIVAGNFKARLPSLSGTCSLSPPTVISGEDCELYKPGAGQSLEILIECDNFPFEVALQANG
jgi:chemotaxis protein CheX